MNQESDYLKDKERSYLLVPFTVFSVIIILSFGLIYWIYFDLKEIAAFCVIFAIASSLSPVIYKTTKSFKFSIFYLLGSSVAIVVYTSFFTGGFDSPIIFWITVLPLTGSFLSRGRRSAFKWAGISLACYLVIIGSETIFGLPEHQIIEPKLSIAHNLALFGILLYNIIFSQLFLDKLSGEAQKLEDAKLELENALKNLQETQAMLVQAEKLRALGTVSSGLAHELLNNLNYVLNSLPLIQKRAEKIQDEEVKSKISSVVTRIEEGVNQSIEICQGFKIYSGNEKFKFQKLMLNKTLSSVAQMMQSEANKKNIQLSVTLEEGLSVHGNESALHQVFLNLIKNAIDASDTGSKIEITATRIGDKCVAKVRDFGSGIPKEVQNRVFDPFFTTKEIGVGSGLGLSISKGTIEKHSGTIVFETSEKGTEFKIELPVQVEGDRN